jgi:hypothetical protein
VTNSVQVWTCCQHMYYLRFSAIFS